MHDRFVRDIAVGKNDLIDGKLPDQVNEFIFGKNRDTIGVEWARQRGRIRASFDIWDLRRGKGDNLAGRVIAKDKIEIMEIPSRRAHDENSGCHLKILRGKRLLFCEPCSKIQPFPQASVETTRTQGGKRENAGGHQTGCGRSHKHHERPSADRG